jgi:hypothetical protein
MLLRVQLVRHVMLQLRARAALAAAQRAEGAARSALLREAARDVAAVRREGMRWSMNIAALVAAGVASANGDCARADDELAAAERGFVRDEAVLHLAIARRQRAVLRGGAAEVAALEAVMRAEGIAAPARMAAMLAPGF